MPDVIPNPTSTSPEAVARYALLGWPVKHSVSPQMQEAAFRALGIAAAYELIETPPADLAGTVAQLRQQRYRGWNITVPHKEQMSTFLDDIDADAAATGSVNTVVNDDGRLCGYSTDGYGLAMAIEEAFGVPVEGGAFVFIGTGGAARATSVYFARHGARELVLLNRTLAKAECVAARARAAGPACAVTCIQLDEHTRIERALAGAHVVIQSTSLGLHEGDPISLPPALLPDGAAAMDMIYRHTPFLAAASERGCPTADGRGMLLYQGARSFELWTGCAAPVEIMRDALNQALVCRSQRG